jgi:ATP-dependent DNA helicase RecG
LIERWGTGTARIIALCREQGLPEPEFNADALQFRVRFLKDPYTPERLRKMGLNERQVQAVNYAKEHGKITNREYRRITGVSDEGARLDLRQLVELGIFQQQGRGRNVAYIPKRFGE